VLFLVKNFLGEKGSVRGCQSSRRSLRTFSHSVRISVHSITRIHYLACQDEFFVNNLFDVKENYEHAFDVALQLASLSRSLLSFDFHCTARPFFAQRLPNLCQCHRRIFLRLPQNLILILC
jgi:hypothetical protein